MNDFNDLNAQPSGSSPEDFSSPGASGSAAVPAGFCQNCGRPLTSETIHRVGTAVFCEPCLEARVHGAPVPPPGAADSFWYGPQSSAGPGSAGPGVPYPGAVPPPPGTRVPHPMLAGLLGLIPGVGAMYNEQYGKGIVHLIIFVVLVSLANTAGIFGLLVAGWVVYMAIEAHHTARARRDGLPLPNPFGLNEIGDRMSFARSWSPTAGPYPTQPTSPATGQATGQATTTPGTAAPYPPAPTPASDWGAPNAPPAAAYTAGQAPGEAAYQPPSNPYSQPYGAPYGQPNSQPYAYTAVPPQPLYADPSAFPGAPATAANRFPGGAIFLIGLGVVFLLATTGIFHGISGEILVGLGLLVLGIWIFVRRMLETGPDLQTDGSPLYSLRLLRAVRPSAFVVLVGLLLLLQGLHVASFHNTWPAFLIVAGLLLLLDRILVQRAFPATPYPPAPYPAAPSPSYPTAPAAAQPAASNSLSILPATDPAETSHDGVRP